MNSDKTTLVIATIAAVLILAIGYTLFSPAKTPAPITQTNNAHSLESRQLFKEDSTIIGTSNTKAATSSEPDTLSLINSNQYSNSSVKKLVESDQQETHFLWVKSIAMPGTTAIQKKAFEIPDGWNLVSKTILDKKGRARLLQKDNFVILEVHAISRNNAIRENAFANAEIIIAKATTE